MGRLAVLALFLISAVSCASGQADKACPQCVSDPCLAAECPAFPAAKCIADRCKGCVALFYDGETDVTSSCHTQETISPEPSTGDDHCDDDEDDDDHDEPTHPSRPTCSKLTRACKKALRNKPGKPCYHSACKPVPQGLTKCERSGGNCTNKNSFIACCKPSSGRPRPVPTRTRSPCKTKPASPSSTPLPTPTRPTKRPKPVPGRKCSKLTGTCKRALRNKPDKPCYHSKCKPVPQGLTKCERSGGNCTNQNGFVTCCKATRGGPQPTRPPRRHPKPTPTRPIRPSTRPTRPSTRPTQPSTRSTQPPRPPKPTPQSPGPNRHPKPMPKPTPRRGGPPRGRRP